MNFSFCERLAYRFFRLERKSFRTRDFPKPKSFLIFASINSYRAGNGSCTTCTLLTGSNSLVRNTVPVRPADRTKLTGSSWFLAIIGSSKKGEFFSSITHEFQAMCKKCPMLPHFELIIHLEVSLSENETTKTFEVSLSNLMLLFHSLTELLMQCAYHPTPLIVSPSLDKVSNQVVFQLFR